MNEFRTLMVPYDFSEHARAALDTALDLGKRLGARELHLVHVISTPAYAYAGYASHAGAAVPPPFDLKRVRESALASLEDAREVVLALRPDRSVSIETDVIEGASIDRSLCDAARRLSADLIVMGTHGRTGLAQVFLGSVAARTLRSAPCPVLSVRASTEETSRS
jgi:nucleotide-binding universal stress UspA family protein